MNANTAIWNRFLELPRSKRDELRAKLEEVNQWNHFERYVGKPDHDLRKMHHHCAIIIKPALHLTDEMLLTNSVQFMPYEKFAKPL